MLVPLGEALVRQRRLGGMIGLALTNYAFIESAVANRHLAHVRSYNACHRSIADPYLVGKLMKSAFRLASQYEQCNTIIS